MIEDEIFKYAIVDTVKLIKYGFMKKNNNFVYEKEFMNNQFKAIVTIGNKVRGIVIDNDTGEEYFNIRIKDNRGNYSGEVLEKYKDILNDIKDKCFNQEYFMFRQTNRITNYIREKYHNEPEFLWERSQHDGIFRNSNTFKWYGIIMNVDKSKITSGSGVCEVINLKINKEEIPELLKQKGYYPAYHMNKKYWISIILDDTLSDREIEEKISESYKLVS